MRAVSEGSTKTQILRAAAELFAAKGYDSVSIKEICDRSDANIAAVHYHFGSKEHLYQAIFQDFGKTHLPKLESILEEPKNADEFRVQMRIYLEQALHLIEDEPYVARIIFRDGHLVNQLCSEIFETTFLRLYEKLISFLTNAQSRGIISKKTDIATLAQMIDAILCAKVFEQKDLRATCAKKLKTKEMDTKAWIQSALSILFDGLIERKAHE